MAGTRLWRRPDQWQVPTLSGRRGVSWTSLLRSLDGRLTAAHVKSRSEITN
jgi:hypothetical protein